MTANAKQAALLALALWLVWKLLGSGSGATAPPAPAPCGAGAAAGAQPKVKVMQQKPRPLQEPFNEAHAVTDTHEGPAAVLVEDDAYPLRTESHHPVESDRRDAIVRYYA